MRACIYNLLKRRGRQLSNKKLYHFLQFEELCKGVASLTGSPSTDPVAVLDAVEQISQVAVPNRTHHVQMEDLH